LLISDRKTETAKIVFWKNAMGMAIVVIPVAPPLFGG